MPESRISNRDQSPAFRANSRGYSPSPLNSRTYNRSPTPKTYSRSPSPSPRRQSHSPAYTDEFESEPEHEQHFRVAAKRNAKPTVAGNKVKSSSRSNQQARPKLSPRQLDQATRRVMSAKNRKLLETKNELEAVYKELTELRVENKTLARQNRINERAVAKYDSQDSQLTSLLSRHTEEVRTLKEQLRRTKDKLYESNAKRKDLDAENQKLRTHLDRLRGLAEEQDLPERDVLARKLTQVEEESENKDRRISELERHLELLQKNHRHEVAIEVHRHKETSRKLHELELQHHDVVGTLKEKEKMLDIQNIYAQRAVRAPHHLNNSTGSLRFNSAGKEDLTPREKMRAYEERRRLTQEGKKHKRKAAAISEETTPPDSSERQLEDQEDKIRQEEERERLRREKEEQLLREEEERRQREQAEEAARRKKSEEEELRLEQERERIRKEEAERIARESDQEEERRRLREQAEEAEKRRKEAEDEEVSRRLALEKQQKEAEERKKKDALLAQLRQMDTNLDSEDDETVKKADTSSLKTEELETETAPKSRKKQEFKPSIENMHKGKPAYEQVPLPNYLQDKPRRKNPLDVDDLFDNDKPPTGPQAGRRASNNSNVSSDNSVLKAKDVNSVNNKSKPPINKSKKEEINMEDLFGSPEVKSREDSGSFGSGGGRNKRKEDELMDDLFVSEKPKKPSAGRRARSPKVEELNEIFGVVESGYKPSGKLLPRRPSVPRGQVNGSSLETEDIEEMLL